MPAASIADAPRASPTPELGERGLFQGTLGRFEHQPGRIASPAQDLLGFSVGIGRTIKAGQEFSSDLRTGVKIEA